MERKCYAVKKRFSGSNHDDKTAKLIRRNWIICAVSLMLAIASYFIFK